MTIIAVREMGACEGNLNRRTTPDMSQKSLERAGGIKSQAEVNKVKAAKIMRKICRKKFHLDLSASTSEIKSIWIEWIQKYQRIKEIELNDDTEFNIGPIKRRTSAFF